MRLTLDLDDITKSRAKIILNVLLSFYKDSTYELWQSAGRKGYHIVMWGVPKQQAWLLREIFDDPKRGMCDKRFPDKPQQVLFTQKNGKKARRMK
jgi:hypothetical protein